MQHGVNSIRSERMRKRVTSNSTKMLSIAKELDALRRNPPTIILSPPIVNLPPQQTPAAPASDGRKESPAVLQCDPWAFPIQLTQEGVQILMLQENIPGGIARMFGASSYEKKGKSHPLIYQCRLTNYRNEPMVNVALEFRV